MVCPSGLLSFCCCVFSGLDHSFFLNFGMVLETYMKLGVTEPDLAEVFFLLPKFYLFIYFLKLLKYLFINFFLICFVMKACVLSCVYAQVPYVRKIWFPKYGLKCSQSVRLQYS